MLIYKNCERGNLLLCASDYHATELLIRLAGNVPTFHPFDIPPQRVLDLGCGEGTWVRYVAAKWNSPDTHIDGLDIQPLWQSGRRLAGPNTLTARVTWKLANLYVVLYIFANI